MKDNNKTCPDNEISSPTTEHEGNKKIRKYVNKMKNLC